MPVPSTFLVFGATGGTGRHFVSLVLEHGHVVRAVVRDPSRLDPGLRKNSNLHVKQGSVTDEIAYLDELVHGTDFVVAMLGDAAAQSVSKVNAAFVRDQLVPAMRRQGVKRFLYQAGGLSKPYGAQLPFFLRVLRNTVALSYGGQHADNEAVMEYLGNEARDIEWIVHRAGIGSSGGSMGQLTRSRDKFSVATFEDCAAYNFRTVTSDLNAIHTCHTSHYAS
ncbi:hypothetical protein LTR86_007641 [Recurvomyces mirabilis]|nr:hypothetical protein LTR86_007641 [Recurvomyces mirabilis]